MKNVQLAAPVLESNQVLAALRALHKGDFSARLPLNLCGIDGEIARTFNEIVELNEAISSTYARVSEQVSKRGALSQRIRVAGAQGAWVGRIETVNALIDDLVRPTVEIARVIEAVAKGDLSQRMAMEGDGTPLRGEFLRIGRVVNTMVEQLNDFASEVSRVAREVGTEGKLGGQARVPGAAGTWKDLTDNVNSMAANLTDQVRNIAEVTTAVAKGDLTKTITVDVKGEILALKSTINTMVDQLNAFASEVSRVAREVGTQGSLGGQARVPGAAGLWRDLTDNVNQLAANLTAQVRAIAEVATAVTKGDLTRSIMVDAMGEVAVVKDTINEMIRNLKDTTQKNNEQNWLKTNLAKVGRMLQGHSDLATVSKLVLSELAPLVQAQQAVFYVQVGRGSEARLEVLASYAHKGYPRPPRKLRIGEGLVGQCAYERKPILLEEVPAGNALRIRSGLHSAAPANIVILPVLFEGETRAVVELASLTKFTPTYLSFLEQLTETIGVVFNTIEANMRTEALLKQSQSLTRELQSQQQELKDTNDRLAQQAQNLQTSQRLLKQQQEELQRTNEQLEEKARLLSEQMAQTEFKNREVEQAKGALEEKAEQLALSSRYKSEFLANMSHELRTPLNSLLILAKLLADNTANNLTPKQTDYAQTIYEAGTDLLSIINDILDLAKIESGTVTLDIGPERFAELGDYVERNFRQVAQHKGLSFSFEADPALPPAIYTDGKRLQQVLKNLLANAFKFTERGAVALRVFPTTVGWTRGSSQLDNAATVVAFAVSDTGIGIPESSRRLIFEAFQQVDGTTSRKVGGTGLGLSISRELTSLLGGEITVASVPDEGSTFTLYLPLQNDSASSPAAAVPPPTPQGNTSLPAPSPLIAAPYALLRPDHDRPCLQPGDRVALIVEDDTDLAETLVDIAHEGGFKGVLAHDASAAFRCVEERAPDVIILDLELPDMDGWTMLDLLKRDSQTRRIPVSAISIDDRMHRYLHVGALDLIRKPTARETLQEAFAKARGAIGGDINVVLVADGAARAQSSPAEVLRDMKGIEVVRAASARQVMKALRERRPDCIVLGPMLGDTSAISCLGKIAGSETAIGMTFVLYETDVLADGDRKANLDSLAEVFVVKGATSADGILAETTLFLRKAIGDVAPGKPVQAPRLHRRSGDLANRKVLIIDDDVRNIFALTAAMEEYGISVLNAETGSGGLEVLRTHPGIDAVLVDIMMPEVDGYDIIRMIRQVEQLQDLPVVAVTAKAMKGDREKCIAAGASDYIAKPLNIDQLMSMLRALTPS